MHSEFMLFAFDCAFAQVEVSAGTEACEKL